MLEQHQRGWADLLWTKEVFVRLTPDPPPIGGVFAQISDDNSTMHFKRLPSQSRKIEERDWTVDIKKFNMLFPFIDPAQDLLIIVAQPEWSVFHNVINSLLEHSTIGCERARFIKSFY